VRVARSCCCPGHGQAFCTRPTGSNEIIKYISIFTTHCISLQPARLLVCLALKPNKWNYECLTACWHMSFFCSEQVVVPNTIQNADPVRRYVGRSRRPQLPPLPALYVSNCSVPTPATRCLLGNQTHYIATDVQHNYKIHFPALFFWNWAKWCGWCNPRSAEYCYSPWYITRGVFGITMIVIISLHSAVRKRGEQCLEASAEEWTDRRTVFREVCGPQGRRNVRRRKSVRLTSRNGEALAELVEHARIIFE